MVRFGMVFLAFVVAIVTTVVPARVAARSPHHDPLAVSDWRGAAELPSDERGNSVPAKRCQSGAGLLGCPFEEPSATETHLPSALAKISLDATVSTLTGRHVPTAKRPPKHLSA